MATFPCFDFANFDLSKIKPSNIDLPVPDVSSLPRPDLSSLPLPDLSSLPRPDVSLPDVEVPGAARATELARDAGYIGVGLVVLGVQQAQLRRRELTDSVRSSIEQLRDAVT